MATSKDYLNYFLEQVKNIPEVTYRPMMGEYLLYYRGKLIGDICDNRVFIKPVQAAKKLMPDAEMQSPYAGAKQMLVLEELEDARFLSTLFEAMYADLPERKIKNKKL